MHGGGNILVMKLELDLVKIFKKLSAQKYFIIQGYIFWSHIFQWSSSSGKKTTVFDKEPFLVDLH